MKLLNKWAVEGDENVKRDRLIQLNLWQYWISANVEIDENVKRDKTVDWNEIQHWICECDVE